MSIVYRIDRAQGITIVLWDGAVTADEYLAHVRRLLSDADWPLHRHRQLGDLRTASVDAIDEATLETAAALFGKHPEITHFKRLFWPVKHSIRRSFSNALSRDFGHR